MTDNLAAVVMAGGLSTRMRSQTPKHLHPLLGRRLVDWVLEAVRPLGPNPLVVVASPATSDAYDGVRVVVQDEPRGSGDALARAREALADFDGDVLVLPDTPLLTEELLQAMIDEHRRERADLTLLSFESERPLPYGRVIRTDNGAVQRVVEEKDASPDERDVRELNASVYIFSAAALWPALERLDVDNAQGELYLTDAVQHVVAAGGRAVAYRTDDADAALGINNRAELAAAAAVLRDRINERHLLAGVTIVDPATTWIDPGVELGPDVVIHPFTVLRGATRVASGAEIGPHAVVVDAEVGQRVIVGPFCYLRPGTVLEEGSKAGTFVEIKNSRIGKNAKVPHSSYIGDAEVGEGTNVAAGNITANFAHQPGRPKGRTTIGRNVRTAVHNTFVAPVEVGDDAWIAAGSVITEDVPPGALAGFPPRQVNKEGYVHRKRNDG
jgi:bifunctional UDP-N-acetylglucosamine pyrophosphorylase/glucosamine-1-phosphate N-acetyltransferase